MRKYLLLAIISLGMMNAYAQKFNGGINGGMSLSWLGTNSKKVKTDGVTFGFTYGVYGDYNLGENFAFSMGLNVLGTGGGLEYKENGTLLTTEDDKFLLKKGAKVSYNLRYLEVPLSIKGKTREIGYITYFAKAGLTPMVRVRARADIDNVNSIQLSPSNKPAYDQEDLESLNINKDINLFSLGYHIGLGAEYSLGGSTALIGELIYTGIFTDITKNNDLNDHHITLNAFAIKIGVKF